MAEAAAVLGISEGEFLTWLRAQIKQRAAENPDTKKKNSGQLSRWLNDTRPVSEAMIRLYLITHPPRAGTVSESPDARRPKSQRRSEQGT